MCDFPNIYKYFEFPIEICNYDWMLIDINIYLMILVS